MDREFKGVWIPKEIWLNEELTLLEKIIFVEIDSLDNENHCTAGNEYFAKFCDCSESKVSKAIKKLKELNMIEELEFDGRHRKIRVVKNAMQSSKKCYAESQNLQANNIDNNQISKNKVVSKDTTMEFQFGKEKSTPKKESLYSKCTAMINDFTGDKQVISDLTIYLHILLEMRKDGYSLYTNVWKGLLRKLKELSDDPKEQHLIISQSVERGYKSFYPVNNWKSNNFDVTKGKSWEENVSCRQATQEELAEIERLNKEREAKGMRTKF